MDGATLRGTHYGYEEAESAVAARSAMDNSRAVARLRARENAMQLAPKLTALSALYLEILDLGGMDALIAAQDHARLELMALRRKAIEAEGWIV